MTRTQSFPCVAGAAILLLCQLACGFHARLPIRSINSVLRSTTPGDFDGSNIGDAGASAEGQALAEEFYEQVRQREIEKAEIERRRDTLTGEEARFRNRAFMKRREVRGGKDVIPEFSFRDAHETSAGFFSGEGDSVYSIPTGAQQGGSSSSSSSPEQNLALVAVFVIWVYVAAGISGSSSFDPVDWNILGNSATPMVELREVEQSNSVWL